MRYWDSSAIVPLLVGEPEHAAARAAFERDSDVATWWASSVECVSAIARRDREGSLTPEHVAIALHRLDELAAAWQEVEPTDRVRRVAVRILRVHELRAADALQLAAAITAAEDQPRALPLVSYDQRLALAAQREGFEVIRPS
jgi:uncharacterized protein